MHRFMYDTDDPVHLPFSTGILATYADLADAALITHLEAIHGQVLWIDRGLGDPLRLATIYDVESRAGTVTGADAWYDARKAAGALNLTVYANRSTMPAVDAEMGPRHHWRWVARLDGVAVVPGYEPGTTPAAVQILGSAALGFHADLSVIFQAGWNAHTTTALTPADRAQLASAEMHLRATLAALATVK